MNYYPLCTKDIGRKIYLPGGPFGPLGPGGPGGPGNPGLPFSPGGKKAT